MLVTDLLYSTPLNRREEANHAPRTARQQWPIFVNMGAVVHFRIEGQRSTTSHPLDQTRPPFTLQVKEPPEEIMEMLQEE
jgi:hypothetical protein